MEEWATSKRIVGDWPLEAGKGKKKGSTLEPPKGIKTCYYVDFSLVIAT